MEYRHSACWGSRAEIDRALQCGCLVMVESGRVTGAVWLSGCHDERMGIVHMQGPPHSARLAWGACRALIRECATAPIPLQCKQMFTCSSGLSQGTAK